MKVTIFLFSLFYATYSLAGVPSCERWPTNIAYTHLKNKGLISPDTTRLESAQVELLATEELRKSEYKEKLYKQVYLITFFKKGGNELSVITVHTASNKECSYSEVVVYLVSDTFNDDR